MLQIEIPQKIDRTELYRTDPKEEHAENLLSDSFEGFSNGKREMLYVKPFPAEDLRAEILKLGKLPALRRQSGVASRSMTFGFLPRLPVQQRDYCARSSADRKHPQLKQALYKYAAELSNVLQRWFPERYEASLQALRNVKTDWVIPNSIFTSGIINQDNPLQYHYDGGNFENTWAVMITFKHQIAGGHLILPELNLKMQCADSSLAIFNNQKELHGVSPIRKLSDDAYRYTVVFYAMESVCRCGTPAEELRRAQVSRTQVEMKRAGLRK